MNNESGDDSVNKSEPGRRDDGQTTGTTAILGPSPATNFSLHSLPGQGSAGLPEFDEELQERTRAPPWGGCDSKGGVAASPGVVPEQERTNEGRTGTPPWGG